MVIFTPVDGALKVGLCWLWSSLAVVKVLHCWPPEWSYWLLMGVNYTIVITYQKFILTWLIECLHGRATASLFKGEYVRGSFESIPPSTSKQETKALLSLFLWCSLSLDGHFHWMLVNRSTCDFSIVWLTCELRLVQLVDFDVPRQFSQPSHEPSHYGLHPWSCSPANNGSLRAAPLLGQRFVLTFSYL